MASATATISLKANTDAEYRALGSLISSTMLAGGWTLVYSAYGANSNWTDIVAPGQNTFNVTEIWRSPAETGLTPFYVKLRYGGSNNATYGLMLEMQLGWTWTSGANLSGVVSTARASANTVAATSTVRLCTVAAGAGYVSINIGNGEFQVGAHTITVGRDRDTSLAKIDALKYCFSYYSAANTVLPRFGYLDTEVEYTSWTAFADFLITTGLGPGSISSGRVGLATFHAHKGGRSAPFEEIVAVWAVDTAGRCAFGAAGVTVQIPMYGVTRRYMVTSNNAQSSGHVSNTPNYTACVLYE